MYRAHWERKLTKNKNGDPPNDEDVPFIEKMYRLPRTQNFNPHENAIRKSLGADLEDGRSVIKISQLILRGASKDEWINYFDYCKKENVPKVTFGGQAIPDIPLIGDDDKSKIDYCEKVPKVMFGEQAYNPISETSSCVEFTKANNFISDDENILGDTDIAILELISVHAKIYQGTKLFHKLKLTNHFHCLEKKD
ncbi:hypothetical protein C2G38_2180223 [Gigaspora rosea]|uniref:Uncharacterized protein n=1 Tax=Gigaspora rosea TaxID=44941 RepID=A0A397VC68_9GLOM|nr:hypothetical protein C2G38_2180223 [Gigaspora rosea]